MKSFLFLHPACNSATHRVTGKGKVCPRETWLPFKEITATVILAVCTCNMTAAAQTAGRDSTAREDATCKFKATQLIVPSVLIATGSIGVCNGWFHSVNRDVKDNMTEWRKNKYVKVDDYLQYLPVAANVGLGLTGIKARHPLRERVACTATAYLVMGIMVNVTKRAVGEKRPDTNARNSFPSGHTATAFMGAELVRKEYGNAAGLCAYAVATSVAVMRLYNNRHWLNDIIAGAGMGIMSAKIGFWLLPWEKRLFGWDKKKNDAALLPYIDTQSNGLAMTFYTTF